MINLQKVLFPLTGLQNNLYYLNVEGYANHCSDSLTISSYSRISFNTYFNSFYESYWKLYTNLVNFKSRLILSGVGIVVVYRDTQYNGCYEINSIPFNYSELKELIVDIPDDILDGNGRIFIDILSTTDLEVVVKEIEFVAGKRTNIQDRLTIGICTFNREKFLCKNLKSLVKLSENFPSLEKVFVVNQGDDFIDDELLSLIQHHSNLIKVFKQDNLGGTGGFTRTLFEALNCDVSDYHLLMDDDVIIDANVIKTAFNFVSNAKKPIAVGGQMLDLLRPNILHEYGSVVDDTGYISGLFHNLDIANVANLWNFNKVTKIDYNAWWFCMIPTHLIKRINLPAPIFIRGDDEEYGLRLKNNGIETVGLPGIALWHEPFYIKVGGWQTYYDFRNRMILASSYDSMRNESANSLFLKIYKLLLIHDYQSAKLILQAICDFAKGMALFNEAPDVIHKRIAELAKKYAPKSVNTKFKPLPDDKMLGKWNKRDRRINFAKQTALLSVVDFSNKSPKHLWDRHVSPENVQCCPYIKSNGIQSYHYLYEPNRQLFRELLEDVVKTRQIYVKALKNNDWHKINDVRKESYWQSIFYHQGNLK